jgi:hypothetical protein
MIVHKFGSQLPPASRVGHHAADLKYSELRALDARLAGRWLLCLEDHEQELVGKGSQRKASPNCSVNASTTN